MINCSPFIIHLFITVFGWCLWNSSSIFSERNIFRRDWYGTSLLFANNLISSSKGCGKRSEIVFVEGLRFGKTARLAFDQSTYSVESCLAQNTRSASSLLNFMNSLMPIMYMTKNILVKKEIQKEILVKLLSLTRQMSRFVKAITICADLAT